MLLVNVLQGARIYSYMHLLYFHDFLFAKICWVYPHLIFTLEMIIAE